VPGTMIRLDRVTKTFGSGDAAVRELSLDIPDGETVVLVGPSGCGKTTTLKMINRLIEPTSGTIEVAGRDIRSLAPHELRRGIGYVIQQIGLFPHRTISQNVATVPRLLGWDGDRIDARVAELLTTMGLDPSLKDRYPTELSGGQRQRVGVARALAADPPVLLMDEPFGAVDPLVRARLQRELVELQQRLHKTIVFVTHDIDEAITLGDRVAILNVGGVLEQYDTPAAILAEPANAFVTDFLGEERGLKRLALIRVRDVDLAHGPVVDAGASIERAKEVMTRDRTDWVGVLRDGRLQGWVWGADLDPDHPVGDAEPRPFRVQIQASATMRSALDAIVNTRNQVAVVEGDDGAYLGMLFVEQMSAELLR
jgi:osmoprotectant transport system ATP-binding protein